MAFCTTCGANVQGAFCPQCGTPVSAAAAQGAPAPAPYSGPAAAPMAAAPPAPAKRRISPVVWILGIVGGLFVLIIIGIVGVGVFAFHKAKQAGLDPDLMSRNPAYAMAKMAIAANPDVEEVSHDEDAGTITVRDKKTGKTTTVTFGDLKDGKFHMGVTDEEGKTATLDMSSEAKLPSWVPAYPGAKQEGTFAVKGDSGAEEGGTVSFSTADSGAKVLSFYQEKAKEMGMKVGMQSASGDGGMLVVTNEGDKRSLSVIVSAESGRTGIQLTYGVKN
jgi:hypothetical protein